MKLCGEKGSYIIWNPEELTGLKQDKLQTRFCLQKIKHICFRKEEKKP